MASCRYLNAFIRDVRRTLDEVGAKKGKRLKLAAWVYATFPENLADGMDVEHGMEQGWLDGVIVHWNPPEAQLIAAAKARKCQCVFNPVGGEAAIAKQCAAGYNLGVDGFAFWDIDLSQDSPTCWPVLRRAGHRKEIEPSAQSVPALPSIRLKTVGGYDVMQGLARLS